MKFEEFMNQLGLDTTVEIILIGSDTCVKITSLQWLYRYECKNYNQKEENEYLTRVEQEFEKAGLEFKTATIISIHGSKKELGEIRIYVE